MTALMDRVATPVDRADFDDLVTLVTQAPPWEKDRAAGVRILLRAIGEGKPLAPDQILARWTWRLARATRKVQDRRVSTEFPEAKRLLGAAANSRGYRHEENVNRLVQVAGEMPLPVGAALLASADGYTPRANAALDHAREELGTIAEIANALADNLPLPKLTARKSRRRRRKRKTGSAVGPTTAAHAGRSRRPEARRAETVDRQPSVPADAEDGLTTQPAPPTRARSAVVLALAQEARDLGGERVARREARRTPRASPASRRDARAPRRSPPSRRPSRPPARPARRTRRDASASSRTSMSVESTPARRSQSAFAAGGLGASCT